jgi:hypothetical protein
MISLLQSARALRSEDGLDSVTAVTGRTQAAGLPLTLEVRTTQPVHIETTLFQLQHLQPSHSPEERFHSTLVLPCKVDAEDLDRVLPSSSTDEESCRYCILQTHVLPERWLCEGRPSSTDEGGR